MNRRIPKDEVIVTAARAVKSGDIHEAPGGRFGYYADGKDAIVGQTIVVHTGEWVEVPAPSALVLAANAAVNFNLTTQAAVSTGGSNIGRAIYGKANGETFVKVSLNSTGNVV